MKAVLVAISNRSKSSADCMHPLYIEGQIPEEFTPFQIACQLGNEEVS
jgi:hypothetical protein